MNEIEFKTPYDWCVEAKLRPLDLSKWPAEWYGSKERHFFEMKIFKKEMEEFLLNCGDVKPNSMPRKTEMYLEYRMFGLVPYNLSPIQQGIQFGHAVVEYGQMVKVLGDEKIYNKWAEKDKTFIILNGGTTNKNPDKLGTLNKYREEFLYNNNIQIASFYEPDLGDQLTAFVFLVDERVFDYKDKYPDFESSPYPWKSRHKPTDAEFAKWKQENDINYSLWVDKIGGQKNLFLRNVLRSLKLA